MKWVQKKKPETLTEIEEKDKTGKKDEESWNQSTRSSTRASAPEVRQVFLSNTAEDSFKEMKALSFQMEEGFECPAQCLKTAPHGAHFLKIENPGGLGFTLEKVLKSFYRRKPDYIEKI